jgi:hypothetical protein
MAQPPTTGSRTGRARGRVRGTAGALALAVLAGACAGGGTTPEPTAAPDSTVPSISAPAPLPDTRGVELAGVAGTVPPAGELQIRGGEADLAGSVTGPDGPVPEAFVLLERFSGDRRASLTLQTDGEGRFEALGVFGGRYRVRAWRAPDLALTVPARRFIRNEGETTLDLGLTRHDGLTVQAVTSAAAPLVQEAVTVTALVTRQLVDERGIVSAPAADGERVDLDTGPGWAVEGPADRTVGPDGRAAWTVTCTEPGSGQFSLRAGAVTTTVDTGCRAASAGGDDPQGDPAPEPDFPLGNRFSAPFAAALPAGRYEVVESPGSCGISYEVYLDGGWASSRATATGTAGFEVSAPFRDVRVIGDSPPCLYERVA